MVVAAAKQQVGRQVGRRAAMYACRKVEKELYSLS